MKRFITASLYFLSVWLFTFPALAQEVSPEQWNARAWMGFAAAIGIGIAAFGGSLGQGRAASAALDGIARNPNASDKMFTPMLLSLALIESLVIYSFVISIIIVLRVAQ
ncbi:MAG: ATP synthase F0 subunit C [Sandaracinaceae bacterium]|nr:ATP synthase F0 subunit C [Sandaracinaceae bacterium]MDW8245931.1 ATP synthase F0 subunit C [Sandaracinaceae bacterium]